jgi:hypothetical protein
VKRIVLGILFAVCMFAITGTAQAVPYADVITYSQYMTLGSSHTFNFDLNNDVLTGGVDIGSEDVINSATLGVNFMDDSDPWYMPFEVALIIADSNVYVTEVETELWTANVLSQVQNDHTLNVTVIGVGGDFYLGNATLSGNYTDRPAGATSPVPEPATMALLGMGVLGLFGLKRKA